MKFANPRNDIAFKKIFGNKNHKEILISFLNAILNFKIEIAKNLLAVLDNQTIAQTTGLNVDEIELLR